MILLLNVFITDKRLTFYDRGIWGEAQDRLSIFKYMLSSLAVQPWSSVHIKCELDDSYAQRGAELEECVYRLFPQANFSPQRNTLQAHWRETVETISALPGEDPVWYFCNDDHIFVDYELDLVQRLEKRVIELQKEHRFVSCYVSHWPENVGRLDQGKLGVVRPMSPPVLDVQRDYFMVEWNALDSCQMVSRTLLRHWWLEHDYGDTVMPKADNERTRSVESPMTRCLIPMRELVRHFDGYSHAGVEANACPPMRIPPGFFEGELRLLYGAAQAQSGFVHINPMIRNYAIVDPKGVELRCVLDDIPLFWRAKVVETRDLSTEDPREMMRQRNDAVLRLASAASPLPLDFMREKLQVALRTFDNELVLPAPDAFAVPNHHSYVSLMREADKRESRPVSVIVLDCHHGKYRTDTLDKLCAQTVRREGIDLLFCALTKTQDFFSPRKVDTSVYCVQHNLWRQGTYSKLRALAAALPHTRSDLVIVTETIADPKDDFIESMISGTSGLHARHKRWAVLSPLPLVGDVKPPGKCGAVQAYALVAPRETLLSMSTWVNDNYFMGEMAGPKGLVQSLSQAGVSVYCEEQYIFGEEVHSLPGTSGGFVCVARVDSEALQQGARTEVLAADDEADTALGMVNQHIIRGRFTEALQVLARLPFDPPDTNISLAHAVRFLAMGQHDQAIEILRTAPLGALGGTELYNLLALMAKSGGHSQEALKAVRNGLKLTPHNRNGLVLETIITKQLGEATSCAASEQRLYKAYPEFTE